MSILSNTLRPARHMTERSDYMIPAARSVATCYRCQARDSSVSWSSHPIFKQLCKSCKAKLANKK